MIGKTILCAALAVSLSLSASAQSSDIMKARQATAEFGACLVANSPAQAAKAVIEDWDSKAIRADKLFAASRKCVSGQGIDLLRASPTQVKAAMAEALIARERLAVRNPLAVPALAYRAPSPLVTVDLTGKPLPEKAIKAQREAIASKSRALVAGRIGECLVRADSDAARAMLTAKPFSDDEAEALAALEPRLAPCVDKGMTVELTRASIRELLALSYYRLARAEAGTVWAGGVN